MKLILIISSLLLSTILSIEVTIEESDGQIMEPNRASRVLFSWCEFYKGNCERECPSKSKCNI